MPERPKTPESFEKDELNLSQILSMLADKLGISKPEGYEGGIDLSGEVPQLTGESEGLLTKILDAIKKSQK